MGILDDLKKWAHPYEDEDEEYEDDFPDLRDRGDTGASRCLLRLLRWSVVRLLRRRSLLYLAVLRPPVLWRVPWPSLPRRRLWPWLAPAPLGRSIAFPEGGA